MKIAVCFSGQPRFVSECSKSIIENVFQDYSVDVFAHLWFDEHLVNEPYKYGGDGGWENQRISHSAIEDFKKIYSPIKLITEESCNFYDSYMEEDFELSQNTYWRGSIGEPNYMERQIKNTLSNFYSMSESNMLKLKHEYKNNSKYDWVFKIRTDVNIHQRINLLDYNKSSFNCTSLMQKPPHINDWICFGGSDIMDVFMGVFPMFQRIFDITKHYRNNVWDNETLHVQILEQMLINIERHPIQLSVPRF
tara:strand:- start:368 stop:1117 length:750 start_codon:yes stop_codon:yes gene_type:complete